MPQCLIDRLSTVSTPRLARCLIDRLSTVSTPRLAIDKTGLLLMLSIILRPFSNGVISQPASSKSLVSLSTAGVYMAIVDILSL